MANKPVIKKPEINEEKIKEALDSKFGTDYERFLIAAGAQNDYCYKEMLKEVIEYLKQHTEVAFGIPYINQKAITALQSQLEE